MRNIQNHLPREQPLASQASAFRPYRTGFAAVVLSYYDLNWTSPLRRASSDGITDRY